MLKTMDEIIGAAHCIVNELLSSEATAEDIQAALRQVCKDWPEGDQQGVLRLALEFANLIGHTTFDVSMNPISAGMFSIPSGGRGLSFDAAAGNADQIDTRPKPRSPQSCATEGGVRVRGDARKGAVAQCGSGTPRGAADAPDTTVVATRVTRVTRYDDESAHAGRSQGRRRGPLGRGGGTGCHGARRRGFPARFALAFADLQLQPPDIDEALWQEAVDAMGRQLDRARDLADTGNTGING